MGSIICPICLEKLDVISPSKKSSLKNESAIKVTECGHIYHTHCLRDWLTEKNPQCPTCRNPLNLDKLINLFPQYDQSLKSRDGSLPNDEADDCKDKFHEAAINNMEIALTSFVVLLEDIQKIRAKITHFSSDRWTDFPTKLSTIERISKILKNKPHEECNALERDLLNLAMSIEFVRIRMDGYTQKIVRMTGTPKGKKAQEDYVKTLGKINRASSEHFALQKTFEKKILKAGTKDALELLNLECNGLSRILKETMTAIPGLRKDVDGILKDVGKVKNAVVAASQKLILLQQSESK